MKSHWVLESIPLFAGTVHLRSPQTAASERLAQLQLFLLGFIKMSKKMSYLRMFFICLLALVPDVTSAQFRDTTSRGDTIHITYGSQPGNAPDSMPKGRDVAIQFLAGEAAFNATFFIIAGNSFTHPSNPNSAFNGQAGLAIFAPVVTVPLAIALASNILQLRSGSWPLSMVGAFFGLFPIGFLLYPVGHASFAVVNLAFGIPIIAVAELVYDLTIPAR
jgi:hypothetical protein